MVESKNYRILVCLKIIFLTISALYPILDLKFIIPGNGSFNSSRNSTLSDKNFRRANKQLAKELNAERMKNATLRNDIVELRNELLTQGEELSDLRTIPQRDPLLVEVEFQKRLAVITYI